MKITKAASCPDCGTAVLITDKVCTACNYNLKPRVSAIFGTPDYITYQYEEATKKKNENEELVVKTDLFLYLRGCKDEDKMAALQDAEMILRQLLRSNVKGENVRNMVKLGKRIGKLADAIDSYVTNGGYINGNFRKTKPTDDIESPEQT